MSYIPSLQTAYLIYVTDEQFELVITESSASRLKWPKSPELKENISRVKNTRVVYSSMLARFLYTHAMLALIIESRV